jgi:putative methionine-R-sulfoxide reductase with GAF domain
MAAKMTQEVTPEMFELFHKNGKVGGHSPEAVPVRPENLKLYRSIWHNWFLLATVLVLILSGLTTAIPPLLGGRTANPWPWAKTDLVLLVGLSITVLVFVGYLAQEQRQIIRIHGEMQAMRDDADRRMQQHAARLRALTRISRIISIETDLQSIFDRITKLCVETFSCHRASLMLFEEESRELVVRSVCGHSEIEILNMRQRLGEGIAGYAAQHREPLLLSGPADYARHPGLEYKDPSLTSAMVVPIIVRDELVGVLNVSSRLPEVIYEAEDLVALEGLSSSAGICIRHTEHVNWMRRMVPHLSNVQAAGQTPSGR